MNYFGTIGKQGIAILSVIIVIRLMTVEEYGTYQILKTTLLLAITIHFGIPKVIDRYYPEYETKNDWHTIKNLIKLSFGVRFVTIVPFCLVLIFFRESLFNTFDIPEELHELIYLFCIVIILEVLISNFQYLLQAQLDYNFQKPVELFFQAFLLVLVWYALTNDHGLSGIVWSWFIVKSLFIMVYFARVVPKLITKFKRSDQTIPFPLKRIVRYGGLYFASVTGGVILNHSVDNYFISIYLGNFDVGLYSFAGNLSLFALALSPVMAIQGIIANHLIRSYSKNKNDELLTRISKLYHKIVIFMGAPILLLAGLYADKIIIYFFKEEYLDAIFLLYGFLILGLIRFLSYPLYPVIRVIERPEIITISMIFALLNIILNIALIPHYELYGAFTATGISVTLTFIFILRRTRSYVNIILPWRSFAIFGINLIGMSFIGFILRDLIGGIITLGICSIITLGIYLGLCYLNKGFDDYERNLLNKAIGKNLFVF